MDADLGCARDHAGDGETSRDCRSNRRPRDLHRRRRSDRPRGNIGRASAHPGGRAGRKHLPRAATLDRARRGIALRPGAAAGRQARRQGIRFRSLAAEQGRPRSGRRLQPRVRPALGQHVSVEVRRRPAVRTDTRDSRKAGRERVAGTDRRAGDRRLPVPGLLQRPEPGLARRRAAGRRLQAELGDGITTSSRSTLSPGRATGSGSRTTAATRSGWRGRPRRRRPPRPCGRRSATASTTTSFTARRSTR